MTGFSCSRSPETLRTFIQINWVPVDPKLEHPARSINRFDVNAKFVASRWRGDVLSRLPCPCKNLEGQNEIRCASECDKSRWPGGLLSWQFSAGSVHGGRTAGKSCGWFVRLAGFYFVILMEAVKWKKIGLIIGHKIGFLLVHVINTSLRFRLSWRYPIQDRNCSMSPQSSTLCIPYRIDSIILQ